jgi:hypothetical protein
VVGQRGRWLARLNPAWEYAAFEQKIERSEGREIEQQGELSALEQETWETGGRALRRSLLQQVRANAPARARALLALTWSSEKADDRAAFIEALASGLSMADEPLLENALDDRSKEVRARAAELLARLPESRLALRMRERALPLLGWKPGGLLRSAQLTVQLPTTHDAAMLRDGIEAKPNRQNLGERAWWLSQIISRTPPHLWTQQWNVQPAVIVGAKIEKEWRTLLYEAWIAAAERYADAQWIEALLSSNIPVNVNRSNLAAALPAPQQEQLIRQLLWHNDGPFDLHHPAFVLLQGYHHPWSEGLAQVVIERLTQYFASLEKREANLVWQYRTALEAFALRVPLQQINAFIGIWRHSINDGGAWGIMIANLEALLSLRRDALTALLTAD